MACATERPVPGTVLRALVPECAQALNRSVWKEGQNWSEGAPTWKPGTRVLSSAHSVILAESCPPQVPISCL